MHCEKGCHSNYIEIVWSGYDWNYKTQMEGTFCSRYVHELLFLYTNHLNMKPSQRLIAKYVFANIEIESQSCEFVHLSLIYSHYLWTRITTINTNLYVVVSGI